MKTNINSKDYSKSICPATWEYIKKGLLSVGKIQLLSGLKQFIDAIATKDYLDPENVKKLEAKYGEKPSVLTWGDFFQSDIAESHFDKDDKEFGLVVDTVRFDLIAAAMIFKNKGRDFFQFVEKNYLVALDKSSEFTLSPEEEEALHLGILMTYYNNLSINHDKIRVEDYDWFSQFSLAKAN